jgi:BirA family biotin operon repressor/biotin-[acetyl-CoA-carboxylase] ligase
VSRAGFGSNPSTEAALALAEALRARLKTERVGRALEVHPSVASTNDLARAAVGAAADVASLDGRTILALHQQRGRGRAGRPWVAPPGSSLLGSVILSAGSWPAAAVTATAALAVADAVAPLLSVPTTIKWPNDVLVEGRKVAGILIEACAGPGGAPAYVVGVGINLNQTPIDFPRDLRSTATSIAIERGMPVDLPECAALFLEALDRRAAQLRAGESAALADAFLDRLGLRHRPVIVVAGGRRYQGELSGLSFDQGVRLAGPAGLMTHPCESVTVLAPG